ncbi:MAG TPA: hypothetical protein VKH43_03710 [Thermoanaerobaculia bacterium]|nr:hypothetical protein [Thermoanaerobaculia bacterium]
MFGKRRIVRFLTLAAVSATPLAAQTYDPALYSGMRWRLVGPFRGGRSVTASGVPGEPDHFYFGAVGGGVWESENAGRTWTPIFDSQPIASIGAVAIAPSNPKVIYVGSGEADMRSDISYGNGMYRSADGGKTWSRIGLEDSRQIAKILVDPKDPDLVYVAALGHGYGPNPERGVFRSKDGGKAWKKILGKDDDTGAVDLAFDPKDSKTMLASLWQTRRPPWNVYPASNGPGSGLYRTTDGGETWNPVAGIPSEKLGRIGVAFARSDSSRAYAIVDAKEGGLYSSRDGGTTWTRVSSESRLWGRGWYFGGVTVDPKNPDIVYICNVALYRSIDGGKTFLPFKGAPGGDDYHELWIDPSDSRRMITATDQGAVVTVDGGKTWSSWYNQPTAQFYHVATDDRFPYWIYGAQQDTGAAATPSRTDYSTILMRDWKMIASGGENGYIVPDPTDPNILYGEGVGRFDWTTLQDQNIDPTHGYPDDYRGDWTLPLAISPRNPKAIYFGNQYVFKTTDAGQHWEKISQDLTRENPPLPSTMDALNAKNSPVAGPRRGVVYSIVPSPARDGMLWAGTNDGLIWKSADEGKRWENVTPKEITPWSMVSILEASRFDAETVYAAVDRHRLDDIQPHIYRTKDGGKTWSAIAQGIPDGHYVNVVREDPERSGLLYAGTERGVFVSFDDGDHWQPLQMNLPACSIRDISVRRGDIVVATHGRSFWVLDDIATLRELSVKVAASSAWLFAPRDAIRFHPAAFQGTPVPKDEPAGENPPNGAILDYYLKADSTTPIAVEILDAKGDLVRRYASDDKPRPPDLTRIALTPDWVAPAPPPPASAGMHRIVWDLHYAPARGLPVSPFGGAAGLWAPPGRYTIRLTAAGQTLTKPLTVLRDPRVRATDADLVRQFEVAREIQAERIRVAGPRAQADAIRKQLVALRGKAGQASAEIEAFGKKLDEIAGPPPASPEEDFFSEPAVDLASLRRLAAALQQLARSVESADAAPTPNLVSGLAQRKEMISRTLPRWEAFLREDLSRLNASLTAAGLPAVSGVAAQGADR